MELLIIKLRPNAGNGLWLGALLPIALLISFVQHSNEASPLYLKCVLFSTGVFYISLTQILKFKDTSAIDVTLRRLILPALTMGALFLLFFTEGILLCSFSAILSTMGFHKIYSFVLKSFPLSFTIGEALLCSQGFVIFLYSTIINMCNIFIDPPRTTLEISTLIIQMGLLTIVLISFLTYKYPSLRSGKRFYPMSMVMILMLLLFPLQILLRRNVIVWLFQTLSRDINTIAMLGYWMICASCAAYAVTRQIKGAKKASTVIRKTFHVLVLLVFLPGILYECSIIYLASGVALGVLIVLELLRILNLPPMGKVLQDGFIVFCDGKDAGAVALTPIYLLVGCALPLWIHPAPCDVIDSSTFNLLPLISGLLSVGVGDTLASYIGTKIGRHKWSGSQKTVEGTLACIFGQIFTIYMLYYIGEYRPQRYDIVKILTAVITVALVEAKTSQVDNIALPLIMYCILL